MVTYAGCRTTWASKMQTEVALSTTEAELISMSEALRTVIPLMSLIEEMMEKGLRGIESRAKVHCKVFEEQFMRKSQHAD